MFVCLCNQIRESEIQSLGAVSSVSGVFRQLGCAPCCGTCVPYIRDTYINTPGGAAPGAAGMMDAPKD